MTEETIHASAFAYQGMGCLIRGGSGTGKSGVAAEALALGATLIGDDQLLIRRDGDRLIAAPAANLAGVIELRHMGLIRVDHVAEHPIHLVIDLAIESERFPDQQTTTLLDIAIPSLQLPSPMQAAPILLYLKAMQEGRILPLDWLPGAAAAA